MNTSAEARVIASFTFIVALLLGAWGALDQLITAPSSVLPDPEFGRLAIALMPFAATAVAFQAANAAKAAWGQGGRWRGRDARRPCQPRRDSLLPSQYVNYWSGDQLPVDGGPL